MKINTPKIQLSSILTLLLVTFYQTTFAGLAVSPGVTTNILDNIDKVQDEDLREMLKAAVWPRFGETYMDLDRPDEELSPFERNYKAHPLNWDEKIENVQFILEQKDDPSELTKENVEYKDIVFGESVIPVLDRRVVEINNTIYLSEEIEKLEAERQAAMSALYDSGATDIGLALQAIEDEYAIKLATLMQAEKQYKQAKIDFLKLENQNKYGRIDDETYQQKTREVVGEFEAFFEIGSEVPVFDEAKIKQLGSSIYDDSIVIAEPDRVEIPKTKNLSEKKKFYYWVIAGLLMALALMFGFFGFKRIKKSKRI